jgi:hypothetical protein
MRDELIALGVGVTSAHLPFKEMYDGRERTSEWTRVSEAYGVLGGGFALCVQATLMACDAGLIEHGDEVVALTSDTAVAVRACRSESFLSPLDGLLVGHIICRPTRYTISKRIHETITAAQSPSEEQQAITGTVGVTEKGPPPALPDGKKAILTTGREVPRRDRSSTNTQAKATAPKSSRVKKKRTPRAR